MCKAWEDQRKEDLQTGIEIGRKQGIDAGVELTKRVIRLDSLGHTPEEIAAETKLTEEKVMYILE